MRRARAASWPPAAALVLAAALGAPGRPVVAWAKPVATATGGPTIDVQVGLGNLTHPGECRSIRVDIQGSSRPFSGTLLLRNDDAESLLWEMPLSAEPDARRSLLAVACPATPSWDWHWSIDGGDTWTAVEPTARVHWRPIVVVVGDRVGPLPALEEAIDPSQSGASSGDSAMVEVAPESAPLDESGWAPASTIVLDATQAVRMSAEALRAVRDHALVGGTVIVAGSEPARVPAHLLAGDAGDVTTMQAGRPGAEESVPGMSWTPRDGGERPALAGTERAWLVARPAGSGRLVTMGLDLAQPAVREMLDADAWRTVLGLGQGGLQPGSAVQSTLVSALAQPLVRRVTDGARAQPLLPATAGGVYLLAAAIVAGAALWVLGRRTPAGASRGEIALVLAAVAVPGFLAGALRRTPAAASRTVVEHWPAERRSLEVEWIPVVEAGETPLPRGVHSIGAASSSPLQGITVAARLRLGPAPAITLASAPRPAPIVVQRQSWRDEVGDVAARLEAANAPRIEIAKGVAGPLRGGPATVDEESFLNDLSAAAVSAGIAEALVALGEPERSGGARVGWVVHGEGAP